MRRQGQHLSVLIRARCLRPAARAPGSSAAKRRMLWRFVPIISSFLSFGHGGGVRKLFQAGGMVVLTTVTVIGMLMEIDDFWPLQGEIARFFYLIGILTI